MIQTHIFIFIVLVYSDSLKLCQARKSKYYDPSEEKDIARKSKPYDPSEEKDIPVKIKLLGDLATPHPDSGIDLGFVPKQVYYQVRRYDEKKRLPQSEALKEASTPEEIINAPRLREVLTHKKTQEVYEEQGYEDAGYDHGGSVRHKQEHERILEDNNTEFGKDDDPLHLEEQDDEESAPPEEEPEENRESDANPEILSPMNSDTSQRKVKPNKNSNGVKENDARNRQSNNGIKERDTEIKQSDTRRKKSEKRNNGLSKASHSSRTSEKEVRKYHDRKDNGRARKEKKKHTNNAKKDKERTKGKADKNRDKEWTKGRVDKEIERTKGKVNKDRERTKGKVDRRIDHRPSNEKSEKDSPFEFDANKYPFYNKLNGNKYTKHSALKYALNPKEIPIKLENQMSFYDSRKLHCDEISPPEVEVPDGEEANPDNAELTNPKRGKPRMGKLGQSIDCLKRKFFGHDPLDNPFFKE
ncbi:hypothetical protein M8J75_003752 [Diaphorina citri]|nr:hypothetical protein M8J75_003752 [Diaphorina citri]